MKTITVPQLTNTSTPRLSSAPSTAVELVELTAADYQEPLVVSTHGDPGAGKSRLIGTAPGAIGVIPLERKTRASVLRSAAEFGREVIMPKIDLIRTGNPMQIALLADECVTANKFAGKGYKEEAMEKLAQREMDAISKKIQLDGPQPMCCARHYYRWHVNRVKSVAFRMAEMDNIKTIAIDTFGQFVEDTLFACYGRTDRIIPLEKKSFNQEVRDFLNAINHKNLILTHHSAQIWEDNKPTKKTKPASSFAKIGHYTSVAVHQKRNDKPKVGEPTYTLSVLDSQSNASLIGMDLLFDEEITFAKLAVQVYDQTEESDWE